MTTAPKPVYQKKRWVHRLIWIFPILVACGAGLYGKKYFEQKGPVITIELTSADGLKEGDTPLLHRGVQIGKVSGIKLSKDHRKALIEVRMDREQEDFAREGADFWIVRPEVSGTELQGLGTIFSGPYIDSEPGRGEKKTEFVGLSKPPTFYGEGPEFIVHSPRLEHLDESSPVYYRGIQVGEVSDVRLGPQGDRVDARIIVWKRYSPLVRTNTKFWAISGFDVKGGIFSGIELQLRSLKTLVSGGVAFATPDQNTGPQAKAGTDFALEKEAKDDWLNWSPHISIRPTGEDSDEENSTHQQIRALGSMAKGK